MKKDIVWQIQKNNRGGVYEALSYVICHVFGHD